jgi:hypothetical protein
MYVKRKVPLIVKHRYRYLIFAEGVHQRLQNEAQIGDQFRAGLLF